MAPMPSITIVKTFSYRGAGEEWSNTYHFDGGDPPDSAHWKTLSDNIIAAEKATMPSTSTIIRAYGHKAGVKTRAWLFDYAAASASVPGTYVPGAGAIQAGDAAAWVRWSTSQFTSRGKPIYLRSYYHDVASQGSARSSVDTFQTNQKTAFETYATAWVTGFSDGTTTHHRAGPNGAIGVAPVMASQFLTTRTLERRGKRR